MAWYDLTILFFVLEIICRKGYFFWLGLIAFFVYLWLPPVSWMMTIPVFLFSGLVSSLAWYAYMHRKPKVYDAQAYGRSSSNYIGREFVLTKPMSAGVSHIEFDDMLWPVYSLTDATELPVGTCMKVRRTNGIILMSEPLLH
jgi:membrane protein implicated in regulation of membrane protease activity